jgi:hypothetical protein
MSNMMSLLCAGLETEDWQMSLSDGIIAQYLSIRSTRNPKA